jgi:RNA polymerase sigma factor (sigma-70 family)
MSKIRNISNIERIVSENIGLAESTAYRRAVKGRCEFDDLKQICSISLMKAAQSYNPDKGSAFSTYACRIMQNDINSYLDKMRGVFENEVDLKDETDAFEYSHVEEQVESSVLVSHLKDTLSKEEYSVLIMVHAQGMSQGEVAKIIGCGQPQVCRILKKAIAKSRMALGGEEKCAV